MSRRRRFADPFYHSPQPQESPDEPLPVDPLQSFANDWAYADAWSRRTPSDQGSAIEDALNYLDQEKDFE